MSKKKKKAAKSPPLKDISPKPELSKLTRNQKLLAACLIGVIFTLSVLTAKRYGMTWDEPWDLNSAERNLRYALTLNPFWMDFSRSVNFEIKGQHPNLWDGASPLRTLAFGNLISSVGCYLFFTKLGVMNSISAHHFPNKLLFAGMLAAVFCFVRRNWSFYAAFAVIPAIAFQPRLWADMQFNLKDFPFACFMAFTIIAIRNAVLRYSWKGIIFSAVLLGLSVATKPNAVLIVVITGVWFIFAHSSMTDVKGQRKKYFWVAMACSPVIVIAVYILVWPFLWSDPISKFKAFLNYYMSVAGKGPPHFQWDKILLFLAVQPPAVLLFATIGIAAAIIEIKKGARRELNIMMLLWLFLPVLRVALPRAYDYDGVRHFIEYSIPLGIFTGVGFVAFCRWLYEKFVIRVPRKAALGMVAVSAALLPLGWAYRMYEIHPYEVVYFNFLVGGAKGAQKIWPTATDYWGSSYRDGMKWLNEHAEQGAMVSVPVAQHIVYDTRTLWLRDDLVFLGGHLDFYSPKTEALVMEYLKRNDKPIYVMYITKPDWYKDVVKFLESNKKPVYMITVDGAPILKIYKNDYSGPNP